MPAPRQYPQELREGAVRMVFEIRDQTGQAPGAIARVAGQLGIHCEVLRGWVRQAEIDDKQRPGTSSVHRAKEVVPISPNTNPPLPGAWGGHHRAFPAGTDLTRTTRCGGS